MQRDQAKRPSVTLPSASFAERLRRARKAAGYRTAKAFAEVLAIDQNTYTRYERGEVEPNIHVIERIWDILRLPPTLLFGQSTTINAGGFADTVQSHLLTDRERQSEQRGLRVSHLDQSAWRVAESYVQMVATGAAEENLFDALQQVGRAYLDLSQDPLGALARLAASPTVTQSSARLQRDFAERAQVFTRALTGPSSTLKP